MQKVLPDYLLVFSPVLSDTPFEVALEVDLEVDLDTFPPTPSRGDAGNPLEINDWAITAGSGTFVSLSNIDG